jgi:hypothetical protein
LSVPLAVIAEIKDLNIENCRKLTDLTLDHMRKLAPKLQVRAALHVCAAWCS